MTKTKWVVVKSRIGSNLNKFCSHSLLFERHRKLIVLHLGELPLESELVLLFLQNLREFFGILLIPTRPFLFIVFLLGKTRICSVLNKCYCHSKTNKICSLLFERHSKIEIARYFSAPRSVAARIRENVTPGTCSSDFSEVWSMLKT